MKVSKIFHTLYMWVLLLPLLIIPIFAININQKSVEPIQVEVQEKISVNFNQLRKDDFTNFNVGVTTTITNGAISFSGTATLSTTYSYKVSNIYTTQNHYYLYRLSNYSVTPRLYAYSFANRGSGNVVTNKPFTLGSDNYYYARYQSTQDNASIEIGNNVSNGTTYESTYYLDIFDITKMGLDDLTNEEISVYFNEQSYLFTESQKMLVNKPTTTIYNDTDIGSQFLYSLYIPVHDYFNFGEYFGMNNMYNWFQLNFFNGTAPLSFYIFFNLMIYWLIISILWLLFDVLMYVPKLIHRWIDKAEM